MPAFEMETTVEPGVTVVALHGELDLSSAPAVEAEVDRLLGDGAPVAVLVLDLRDLAFMDSTGLRAVLRADARMRDAGGRLAVVDGADAVRRVFEMTGMHERLTFVPEPQAAAAG